MRSRLEMFEQLGLSKEVAALANQASYKAPIDRTPEEKEAIHQASEAIYRETQTVEGVEE